MLRLRNVAALQRSLNTKAFVSGAETKDKDESKVLEPAAAPLPTNKQLGSLIRVLKSLPNQKTVIGCQKLEDVHEIMRIYRQSRDHPDRKEKVVASDIVNVILNATRQRDQVFRRSFIKDRILMIQDQNKVLVEYLEEIISDIAKGNTVLSAYAVTYLLTAFSRVGQSSQIIGLWKQLQEISQNLPDLAKHLQTPTVVSAALSQADPSTLSLQFVESTYQDTVESSGSSLLLDEALIRAYLRVNEPERVAEKYAALFEKYSDSRNDHIFDRIHSRILTEVQDLKVATAFYEMAVRPQTHIGKVHPGAIASFIKLDYSHSKDWNKSADLFLRSVGYFSQRHPDMPPQEFGNIMNAIWNIFVTNYPEDTQEARNDCIQLLDKFRELYPSDWIFFNIALSQIPKHWLGSEFSQVLADRALESLQELGGDSCRVLLNSRPSLETVAKVWGHRTMLPESLTQYDYAALIKSANTQDKAKFVLVPLVNAVHTLAPGPLQQLRSHCQQNELVRDAIAASNNDILSQLA